MFSQRPAKEGLHRYSCSLHTAPHHWLYIFWESDNNPLTAGCGRHDNYTVTSDRASRLQPAAQPSPAQPSPATWHRSWRCCRCEAGPQSSGTLDRTHSFTTFADFTPPLKGVGSLKNWKSSFNLLYSVHIHFMFWNENKIDLTIIMVYKFSTILFHCFH